MRTVKDTIMKMLIFLSAFITIGILVWIIGFVVTRGIKHINLAFLFTFPKGDEGGIFPYIMNTLYMILLSLSIATPIGVLAAIYLVEYTNSHPVVKFIVRVIRFATESLAGIPSIIFGLFGMLFFVIILGLSWSLLSGALTLSIMVLPTIIRTTEEALKAVPSSFREASLGLGASKLRTVYKAILPSAIPGILTGVILSVGRVVGETAAVIFTAGSAVNLMKNLSTSGRTLSVHMYILAKEGISFDMAYATATILLIIVFVINLSTNMLAKRLNKAV